MRPSQGFTTVELIVTLFVAAMMVISGYQLYSAVNSRGTNTRMMSEASNIGYEALRKFGGQSTTTVLCSAGSHPTQNVTLSQLGISDNRVPNLSIQLSRCLPLVGSPVAVREKVMRVTAKVTYDSPTKEVVHATYISQ